MNASYEWLRELVPFDLAPRELRDLLTARCATVDEVRPVREDLRDIVVGRVVEATRHPESDHLWLTKVDAGKGELIDVVCGAANVEAGASYPFASVGATLPGGLKIEKRKIRGHVSEGMLCSSRELELGTDDEGIMTLATDAAPGTPFLEAQAVGDTLFVVDVLPNRPDLLSHRGIAREIAAATGSALSEFGGGPWAEAAHVTVPQPANGEAGGSTDGVSVRIDDAEGCSRYLAVVIRGVTVGPSPDWLKKRLAAVGARSINNVVDVTNYMLHGYGQPMHGFNLAKLGGELVIRRARKGEKLVTLDGVDRTLSETTTVIAGKESAAAIAGVIGGRDSEVTDATRDVLLEVAIFDPRRVRAARRALGISTDASYRFERHVDADSVPALAMKAASLIAHVAGGKIAAAPIDLYPRPKEAAVVSVRPTRASTLLGDPIPGTLAVSLLESVGFKRAGDSADAISVRVPSWRSDVTAEVDLIEEIARLKGYDSFSSDLRPFRLGESPDAPLWTVAKRVREVLVAEGILEARPMPFVAEGVGSDIRLRNPLAENEAFLRCGILQTLASRAEHNLAHMEGNVRLFEIGTVFHRGDGPLPVERTHVGVLAMGAIRPPHFTDPRPPAYSLWDMKAIAKRIVTTVFGDGDLKYNVKSLGQHEVLLNERPVAAIVQIPLDAPAWAAPAFGVEIDLTDAPNPAAVRTPRFRPLPTTPAVEVDLALVAPEDLQADRIEGVLRKHAGDLLEKIELFDEFRGPGIEPGFRSLGWRLTFRHPERTLREQEVEARRLKILRALEEELGVRQRTS